MSLPRGMIARVEHQWSHQKFTTGVSPDTIMVDMVDARQIVRKDETAESYFGSDSTIITTSTVPDEKLDLISWDNEKNIIESFNPDYHIPTDYSIYGYHSQQERLDRLVKCMEGTEWMAEKLPDSITIIPLVKGFTRAEREVCYRAFDYLGYDYAAFYATQYFTGGTGIRIDDLEQDVTQIQREMGIDLLVMGLLSPEYVKRLPPNVVCVSGQNQWRKHVQPREKSVDEMREAYEQVKTNVERALFDS